MRQKSFLLLLIFVLAVILAPVAEAQLSSEYAGWEDGPEGFLLTKKEKKAWDKISSDADAKRFIELFWARRNPEVNNPYNPFKARNFPLMRIVLFWPLARRMKLSFFLMCKHRTINIL